MNDTYFGGNSIAIATIEPAVAPARYVTYTGSGGFTGPHWMLPFRSLRYEMKLTDVKSGDVTAADPAPVLSRNVMPLPVTHSMFSSVPSRRCSPGFSSRNNGLVTGSVRWPRCQDAVAVANCSLSAGCSPLTSCDCVAPRGPRRTPSGALRYREPARDTTASSAVPGRLWLRRTRTDGRASARAASRIHDGQARCSPRAPEPCACPATARPRCEAPVTPCAPGHSRTPGDPHARAGRSFWRTSAASASGAVPLPSADATSATPAR